MAEEELAVVEVMNMLEAEVTGAPAGGALTLACPGPDIPALREQLAVLVTTGKAQEAIGVQLTQDQVKRLTDKDVEKYFKRYESYGGSKTTESLIDGFIFLVTKAAGSVVKIKDIEAYRKEIKEDYIITKELSCLAGNLALQFGRWLALANSALITAKHIDFTSTEDVQHEPVVTEQVSETE